MIELSSAQSAPGLAELFEHSPACLGLFEAKEPFRVIAHNPAFQKVLDEPFRTKGVAGLTLPEFANNPDRVLAVYRQVAETGEPFVVERYRYDGLERGPTWWNWSLTPVRRDGRITSLVLTSVEVTEAVLAQQKLEAEIEARRDAEELLAGEQELFQRIVDIIPVRAGVGTRVSRGRHRNDAGGHQRGPGPAGQAADHQPRSTAHDGSGPPQWRAGALS